MGSDTTKITALIKGKEIETATITLDEVPATAAGGAVYVLIYDAQNNLICEPFSSENTTGDGNVTVTANSKTITIADSSTNQAFGDRTSLDDCTILIDYYVAKTSSTDMQINITPDKFGGAFYVEASTLFRDQATQLDMPAEFIIPNARVQSNFSFAMAGSGDPSSFTFTMDAFPDYTRFDTTEKVLASIQIIGGSAVEELTRERTNTTRVEKDGVITNSTTTTTPTSEE
jgi:hypothetical protein